MNAFCYQSGIYINLAGFEWEINMLQVEHCLKTPHYSKSLSLMLFPIPHTLKHFSKLFLLFPSGSLTYTNFILTAMPGLCFPRKALLRPDKLLNVHN